MNTQQALVALLTENGWQTEGDKFVKPGQTDEAYALHSALAYQIQEESLLEAGWFWNTQDQTWHHPDIDDNPRDNRRFETILHALICQQNRKSQG
jgi:hypothetical protein